MYIYLVVYHYFGWKALFQLNLYGFCQKIGWRSALIDQDIWVINVQIHHSLDQRTNHYKRITRYTTKCLFYQFFRFQMLSRNYQYFKQDLNVNGKRNYNFANLLYFIIQKKDIESKRNPFQFDFKVRLSLNILSLSIAYKSI